MSPAGVGQKQQVCTVTLCLGGDTRAVVTAQWVNLEAGSEAIGPDRPHTQCPVQELGSGGKGRASQVPVPSPSAPPHALPSPSLTLPLTCLDDAAQEPWQRGTQAVPGNAGSWKRPRPGPMKNSSSPKLLSHRPGTPVMFTQGLN